MLKNKNIFLFTISLLVFCDIKAQVWFPEGNYTVGSIAATTSDNSSVYAISRVFVNQNESVWQASKWDGKFWLKFPLLTLNKDAEVLSIKVFQTSLYVAGNLSFHKDTFNGMVRFKNGTWQGINKFTKANSLAGNIISINVFDNKLLVGGNYNKIGKDSIPFLSAYDGASFAYALSNCKNCSPNNIVYDIATNDTSLAIGGSFTRIAGHTSKYLYRIKELTKFDTFLNIVKPIEKLAVNGEYIYASYDVSGYKKIIRVNSNITDISANNMDSIIRISKLLWYDGSLLASGSFKLLGQKMANHLVQFNSQWNDMSNNYPLIESIHETRGILWAIGNSEKPISLWTENKNIMRFYKNSTLLKAKVYIDSNNNCNKDANEKGIGKQFIKLAALFRGVFTNENGYTEILLPNNSTTYKFEIKPLRNYIRSNCSDTVVSKTLALGKYIDSIQFPLIKRSNVNDVRVVLVSPKGAQIIKDKRVDYVLAIINVGSNAVSGTTKLKVNKFLTNITTVPAATKSSDSIYTWTYLNLKPDETRLLKFSGYPSDTTFKPNKQITAQASASFIGINNGYTDDDNDSISQSVNSNQNPFKKYSSPAPSSGDSVSYLPFSDRQIRYDIVFNNFTTDTVFNAVISDTLDLNLDMSYIQETGSNKPYYTEIQTDPNNNYRGIIIWHFNNIKLPPNPSKNFENLASSSYIGFKVVMKPTSTGNLIKNTAAVFFDNQYAGKTNIAYCMVLSTGIDKIKYIKESSIIYPNPGNGVLYFKSTFSNTDNITIYNTEGKVVYQTNFLENTSNFSLNTEKFNSGLYIVQCKVNGQLKTEKLIIE